MMPPAQRPNILFISAEQQRGDTLHCAATADGVTADWMITPNLDSLASQGTLFQHAFSCAAPFVSSPAAFYTGLYPHNTGLYGFYREGRPLPGQLFDRVDDPRETRNLWNRPKAAAIQAELTARLLDWLYCNQYKHRDLYLGIR
jgi:hypothetical protein